MNFRLNTRTSLMNRAWNMVALLAILSIASPRARADSMNTWVFEAASTILGGDIELISGSFTFDSATDTESGVSVTLTGPAPMAGTYTEPLQAGFVGDTIYAYAPGLELDISFLNALTSSNSPDAVGKVTWLVVPQTRVSTEFFSSASFGDAVIVAPEPGSLMRLVSGVGIVGFAGRRRALPRIQ